VLPIKWFEIFSSGITLHRGYIRTGRRERVLEPFCKKDLVKKFGAPRDFDPKFHSSAIVNFDQTMPWARCFECFLPSNSKPTGQKRIPLG
jgi:hypothetical protein